MEKKIRKGKGEGEKGEEEREGEKGKGAKGKHLRQILGCFETQLPSTPSQLNRASGRWMRRYAESSPHTALHRQKTAQQLYQFQTWTKSHNTARKVCPGEPTLPCRSALQYEPQECLSHPALLGKISGMRGGSSLEAMFQLIK